MSSLIRRITRYSRSPAGQGLMRQVQSRLSAGKTRNRRARTRRR